MRFGALIHGGGALRSNDHLLGSAARINRNQGGTHAAKEYGSVIATEFSDRHSKKLRACMITAREEYENMFRDLVDAVPLRPGASRKFLCLSLIGAMAWSLVWYKPGGDDVGEIAKQFIDLFRSAKDICSVPPKTVDSAS